MTDHRPYGAWWRRTAGYTLRMVIPVSLLSQLVGTLITGRSSPDGATGTLITIGAFLAVIATCNLTGSSGQTWVHRLMGLRVCSATTGQPAGIWRLMVRDLAHLVDWAILGFGFLAPLVDPRKRTFADMITGTIVVHAVGETRQPNIAEPSPHRGV